MFDIRWDLIPLAQIKAGQEAFELGIVDERNRAKGDLEKQLKRAQDAAEASGVSYEVDVSLSRHLGHPSSLRRIHTTETQKAADGDPDEIRQGSTHSLGCIGARSAGKAGKGETSCIAYEVPTQC